MDNFENKNLYNKTRHDSSELIYMYGKICNMEKNTFIGRYKVLEYLGKGGYGVVYKCYDSILNTEVALKFLDPIITRNSNKFHRIKREINISRKITDDRIVKIYSMEKYYDVIFLVMEFIDGVPLSDIIDKKAYEWDEFKPILIEILKGLKLLHINNIIHRDLKPGNIMILKNGDIKIVDFGLAKEITDTERTSATEEFAGTAEFISPEQVNGEPLDTKSDIYQVGLIIFKALSGQHPFDSSSTMELLVKYITVKPKKIAQFKKNLPPYAQYISEKMLERKKKNRIGDIDKIVEILENESIKFSTKLTSISSKKKSHIIFIVLILLISLILAYISTYGSKKITQFESNNGTLTAMNKFKRVIWKKDFSPDLVIKAFIMPIRYKEQIPHKEQYVIFCLLKNNQNKLLPVTASINSAKADNKIVKLSMKGTIKSKKSFSDFFKLQSYGFAKLYKVIKIKDDMDYNMDKHKDILLYVGNSLDMYPHALIYFKDNIPIVYTNPGAFDYKVSNYSKNSLSFTIFGNSSLISNLNVFSEISFIENNVFGIPNLSEFTTGNYRGYSFFLPKHLEVVDNNWSKKGIVNFISTKSGEKFTISKDYKITETKNGIKTTYSDSLKKIKKFNIIFNTFYKEQKLYKNYLKAGRLIDKLIDMKFENPYLNSALYYYKGDNEICNIKYKQAQLSLFKGLNFYPDNSRIAGRLSQISFLMGNPLGSIDLQEKMFSSIEDFGGLPNGTKIFRIFMYLSAGLQAKAEEDIAKAIRNSKHLKYSLFPLISLYNGKLLEAEKLINEGLKDKRSEITDIQYRLMCSKIYILNNSNLKRAEFFLEDIVKYSHQYNHLAELSLSYLIAKSGRHKEAETLSIRSLKKLQAYAKGNFSTRIWMFYEYYIYAKTMEIVGNKLNAIKGYKECSKIAPNSYLAKLSKKRLAVL